MRQVDASTLVIGAKVRDERAGYNGTVIAAHPHRKGAWLIAWHKWENEDIREYVYPGTLVTLL